MLVQGVNIYDNGGPGVWGINVTNGGLQITGNTIMGNGTAGNPVIGRSNIQVQTSTGVVITNNVVRAGSNSTLPSYGISLNTDTGTITQNNDLRTSGAVGDYFDYSGTGNITGGNTLTGTAPTPL